MFRRNNNTSLLISITKKKNHLFVVISPHLTTLIKSGDITQ